MISREDFKVNILGTFYAVNFRDEESNEKFKKDIEIDGYIDTSTKQIYIRKLEKNVDSMQNMEEYTDRVIRHEIIHAFFHESGLADRYDDEQLVDWIALQYPKIRAVIEPIQNPTVEVQYLGEEPYEVEDK